MAKPKHDVRHPRPNGRSRGRLKRSFDLLVVVVPIVVGLPLWALLVSVVASLVYFDSGRPILFRTRRVGLAGGTFDMYKFRTMGPGAEHRGPITRPNDPRITRVGRFLRKTGLDELPPKSEVDREKAREKRRKDRDRKDEKDARDEAPATEKERTT